MLFKTALAIFGFIEDKINNCMFEDSLFLIKNSANSIDEELLFKKIFASKITKEKFSSLLEKELIISKNKKK